MAHEISMVSGRAEIAYAGDTPWHGLGTRVDGLQTAQAMIEAAGLGWTVEARPLFLAGDVPVTSHRAIVRADHEVVLGVVSDRYFPIQNAQAAEMMDALVTEGGAHVEVAGALGSGERCWMLAQIPGEFEVVKGDAVRPYALVAWGHDGKHGLAAKLTPIRVVCNNTLTAAGFGVRGKRWSQVADVFIRHRANAVLRIDEARKALGLIRKQVEATGDAFRAMAGARLTSPADYFTSVFPMPADITSDDGVDAEKLERWNAHQAQLLELYEGGKGQDIPGVRGTVWAGYNAVTEWADHTYPVLKSGKVSSVRQESVLFGSYAELKRKAFTEALSLVG